MKKLSRIILVQWYLFEGQEIPIVGHTAIVGANGAGKSSIIDAVQTLLAGGDKNKISLNKGSNEKSSRTIREYCLGIVSDPNSMVRVDPRPSANTYIVLCFRDDETDEYLCAGTSIWSSTNDPKELFNGYFITRGDALTLDLFTENVKGGVAALPWNQVRDRLLRRFKLGTDFQKGASLILPSKGPGDFTRNFYTVMSAEPGAPMNSQTIVKSLLSAIAFKPIADPTKFVQQNMLDPSNINIRELKASLDFWRELRDKAKQTADCIDALGNLEKICESVQQTETDILLNQYASLTARIEQCVEISDPAQCELDDLEDEMTSLSDSIASGKIEEESVRKELWAREEDRKRQNTAQKIAGNEKQIKGLATEVQLISNDLQARRLELCRLADIEKSKNYIPDNLYSAINTLLPLVRIDDDLLSGVWPKDPVALDASVAAVLKGYDAAAQEQLRKSTAQLWQKISPILEESQKRKRMIDRLAHEKSPIEDKTIQLMALLKKNRIETVPLCDLIDVKDETWRRTIEAVLGNIREALVVDDPNNARDAIRLYRYEGAQFRGAHIVNTTKTKEWLDKSQKKSLAELVETDNSHARAFINLRLGNILCVEKESDLLKESRAATSDLMLASGGTTTMMREPNLLILGRSTRPQQLAKLRKLHEVQTEELERLQKTQEALAAVIGLLDTVHKKHRDSDYSYAFHVCERENKSAEIERLKEEIALLKASDDKALIQKINDLTEKLKILTESLAEKDNRHRECLKRSGVLNATIDAQTKAAEALEANQRKIRGQCPNLDFAAATALLDRLRTKFESEGDPCQAIIQTIDKALKKRNEVLEERQRKVVEGLRDFLNSNKAQTHVAGSGEWDFDTFEDRATFIRERKRLLEETTLASYSTQATNALHNVEMIFRDKFIGRLGERLKEVKDNIDGLNKTLKNRPFNGEYFQFRAHPAPELKAVYDLAIHFEADRSAPSAVGGLFDPANEPNSPHRVAVDYIKQAFQDEELGKLIQDHRNYFVFDVEMYLLTGEKVANMKHRIAKGSGGENMAPFYVAIGSSLASAYKIQSRPGRLTYGGMNLAPFDEAFSKLDASNIYNCLEFLKEIHLQVLIAAPDDKYTTLASQMNTIIWITRDGGNIDLEVEYISAKAHSLLQSDNPFKGQAKPETVGTQPAEVA